ncbi:MAG: hypothetical protein RHS_5166 [Robinsoniella sp. RHS]|uniref:TcpE family conjugal transfer membrane protein n=1 Tax=Robinsoniella sp. RHS TaxID=1504536 RepID=UPI00064A37E6|nr:MAG: hypothetical protein RHS_5166 [Robinsoniella sp. RHS]
MIVRSYDGLWHVGKRLYRVEGWKVPGSPLYTQIAFFAVGLAAVFLLLSIFGQNGGSYLLVKYVALPYGFSTFMTRVKYDGKRPDRYVRSVLRFYLYPHRICRYEAIKKPEKSVYDGTMVRVIRNHLELEKPEQQEKQEKEE